MLLWDINFISFAGKGEENTFIEADKGPANREASGARQPNEARSIAQLLMKPNANRPAHTNRNN